jgi:serine protease Do
MRTKKDYPKIGISLFVTLLALLAFTDSTTGSTSVPFASQKQSAMINSEGMERLIGAAIARVKPALVRIHVVSVKYQNGREVKFESTGSGVIITREGYVITNHHVAGNAKQITCTLSTKEEIDGDLVSTDPLTDISVIKLRHKSRRDLPFAEFGDSSRLRVGDHVLAMGSPFALSQSVTMGIVSNVEIILPKFFWPLNRFTLDGEDVGSVVRWIGHDAPIYGGNSGGPLVNLSGEVVGINEISLGIGGAIPGNLAKRVAEDLIRFGKVLRSWIGLEIQPLLRHSGRETGAVVSGTIEGSPAERAGFLPGDILLKINGKEITVRFQEELPLFNQFMMEMPIGEEAEAIILRQTEEMTLSFVPQEREYIRSRTSELREWGITARNLSFLVAKEMKRDDKDGVLVTTVRAGGPCGESKPRIADGDVIVEVNGKRIKNVQELVTLTEEITRGGSDSSPVMVAFERKRERYLTVVRLTVEKETQHQGFEVRKAWLPVGMQVLTRDIARSLGLSDATGMRITQVYSPSSAERAGLKAGDIIAGMDGETIRISSSEDYEVLPARIRQYKIGSTVQLAILRGKEQLSVPVELEQSPPMPGEMKKYTDTSFDFTVRDIAFLDRAQEEWKEDQGGVLIEAVSEGGWASLARVARGDLICAVNGESVTGVDSFRKVMKNIALKRPKSVLFQIKRGIHTFFVEMEPAWNGNP